MPFEIFLSSQGLKIDILLFFILDLPLSVVVLDVGELYSFLLGPGFLEYAFLRKLFFLFRVNTSLGLFFCIFESDVLALAFLDVYFLTEFGVLRVFIYSYLRSTYFSQSRSKTSLGISIFLFTKQAFEPVTSIRIHLVNQKNYEDSNYHGEHNQDENNCVQRVSKPFLDVQRSPRV